MPACPKQVRRPVVEDQVGPGNKFITPTVANGRVYVGTTYGVAVYGLRN